MNDQIISQIKNLLSPAARAYLQKIVDGKVPLKRTPGISPLPDGLDSTQVSMLHEIAQANEPGSCGFSYCQQWRFAHDRWRSYRAEIG